MHEEEGKVERLEKSESLAEQVQGLEPEIELAHSPKEFSHIVEKQETRVVFLERELPKHLNFKRLARSLKFLDVKFEEHPMQVSGVGDDIVGKLREKFSGLRTPKLESTIDYIVDDVAGLIKQFSPPMIASVRFESKTPGYLQTQEYWHYDGFPEGNLRILRTYHGKQTSFTNHERTREVAPPTGTVSIHKGDALHNAPNLGFWQSRLNVIIDLYPPSGKT